MSVDSLLALMENHSNLAILISLVLNIIIAILGFIPSIFITTANVLFFGFFKGFLISLLGEALGAVISFYLYRKGFKRVSQKFLEKNKRIKKIIDSDGKEAFGLIFSFRLFPYMPSGLVTYAAAIGRVNILTFTVASTLGKIPSMFLEVLASASIIYAFNTQYFSIAFIVISIILILLIIIKRSKK